MAITRANAESVLVRRAGKWMEAAGLNGSNVAGDNPDLNDPLGFALRWLGLAVTNIASVSNADVAAVSSENTDAFLDVAELRLLESTLQNYDLVSMQVGPRSEDYSDLREGLETAVNRKRAQVERSYGTGQGTASLSAGVIGLDFQQHADEGIAE